RRADAKAPKPSRFRVLLRLLAGSASVTGGGVLLLRGTQDRARGHKSGFAPVGDINWQVCGAAQHHQGEPAVGRVPDDQQVGAGILAANSHYVLAFAFPSWPVEVGWSLQWRPIDVDGGDPSEQGSQDRDKAG